MKREEGGGSIPLFVSLPQLRPGLWQPSPESVLAACPAGAQSQRFQAATAPRREYPV